MTRELTNRQKEILNVIIVSRGRVSSARELASYFGVSFHTMRTQMSSINHRMGAHSILEAVLRYIIEEEVK